MASSYKIVGLNFYFVSQNKDFKNTNGICELCKKPLYGHNIIVGKCHHAFHEVCMNKIGHISCPIDNISWNTDYIENSVSSKQ